MEGQKIWNNILSNLKLQVSSSTFKTWFAGTSALEYKNRPSGKLLIVAVRNNFLKEQIETRYSSVISKIIEKCKVHDVEIIFVVSQKNNDKITKNEPIFSGIPLNFTAGSKTGEILNQNHLFENFVVGQSNNLAYLAASQMATNLGTLYNPLMIYGPTGVGKTHLLQAIGNEVFQKNIDSKVIYATAEKFTNDYIESLRNRTQASFRTKYRNIDLLLIDDIQFLAGKESTQDEFFHTFNDLYLRGRQIVVACDRHPKELGKVKDRLVSRFLGGMTVDVGLPDLEMKIAILKTKGQSKGVDLDDEIASQMAEACQGGARELEGMVVSILGLMKISGDELSIEKIKNILGKNGGVAPCKITPEKIIGAVCRHYKVGSEDLRSSSRKASVVMARQALMYLLRKRLGLPLTYIGELVGGRDHSTVLYGIEKIGRLIATNQKDRDEILRIQSLVGE